MPDSYQSLVTSELPGEVPGSIVGEKHCPVLHRRISYAGRIYRILYDINERDGKLRDELLNREIFATLAEAKILIE